MAEVNDCAFAGASAPNQVTPIKATAFASLRDRATYPLSVLGLSNRLPRLANAINWGLRHRAGGGAWWLMVIIGWWPPSLPLDTLQTSGRALFCGHRQQAGLHQNAKAAQHKLLIAVGRFGHFQDEAGLVFAFFERGLKFEFFTLDAL